jgi:transcription elongation factor GreA
MTTKKNIFTKEGFQKLKEQLERLKTETRLEIAAKLNEASEFGDLSENAAYQAAMELRDMNENKIAELEDVLANAKVVKAGAASKDSISIGSTVKLEDKNGITIEFEIVGTGETDLLAKKFNADSPLVSAVLGKKKGDEVEVSLPTGKIGYKVVSFK